MKRPRKRFAVLKRQEAEGQERLLEFSLTKAGLVVHRHACRRSGDVTLDWGRLAAAAFGVESEGVEFQLGPGGVEVKFGRRVREVTFRQLTNIARVQPELFPALNRKEK